MSKSHGIAYEKKLISLMPGDAAIIAEAFPQLTYNAVIRNLLAFVL